jgi:CHASE1-domain containing sensor protein
MISGRILSQWTWKATAVVGTLISFGVSFLVSRVERDAAIERFEVASDNRIASVSRAMDDVMTALSGLQALCGSGDEVTGDRLRLYFEGLLGTRNRRGIRFAGWVRAPGAEETESGTEERPHGESYPIAFLYPAQGNETFVSFDVGGHAGLLQLLLRSRDEGKTLASSDLKGDEARGPQLSLIFAPVYRAVGIIRIESIEKEAVTSFSATTHLNEKTGTKRIPVVDVFRTLVVAPTHEMGSLRCMT